MAVFMRSARLDFSPPELDDVDQLAEMINQEKVRRFLDGRVFPADQNAQRGFVEMMQQGAKDGSHFLCVVREHGKADIVGCSGLHGLHRIHRRAEWGVVVVPESWNQGYGREIAEAMVDHAFLGLNLHSVMLRVRADHVAGRSCYRKAGFIEEGVMREAVYGEGRYHDQVVMSVIRSDWDDRRKSAYDG